MQYRNAETSVETDLDAKIAQREKEEKLKEEQRKAKKQSKSWHAAPMDFGDEKDDGGRVICRWRYLGARFVVVLTCVECWQRAHNSRSIGNVQMTDEHRQILCEGWFVGYIVGVLHTIKSTPILSCFTLLCCCCSPGACAPYITTAQCA